MRLDTIQAAYTRKTAALEKQTNVEEEMQFFLESTFSTNIYTYQKKRTMNVVNHLFVIRLKKG